MSMSISVAVCVCTAVLCTVWPTNQAVVSYHCALSSPVEQLLPKLISSTCSAEGERLFKRLASKCSSQNQLVARLIGVCVRVRVPSVVCLVVGEHTHNHVPSSADFLTESSCLHLLLLTQQARQSDACDGTSGGDESSVGVTSISLRQPSTRP